MVASLLSLSLAGLSQGPRDTSSSMAGGVPVAYMNVVRPFEGRCKCIRQLTQIFSDYATLRRTRNHDRAYP